MPISNRAKIFGDYCSKYLEQLSAEDKHALNIDESNTLRPNQYSGQSKQRERINKKVLSKISFLYAVLKLQLQNMDIKMQISVSLGDIGIKRNQWPILPGENSMKKVEYILPHRLSWN